MDCDALKEYVRRMTGIAPEVRVNPVTCLKDSLLITDMKASRQRPVRSTREIMYKPGDDTADLSWSEATHLLNGTRLLTDRHPVAVPLNFKGVLRLPQAVILEAAIALESNRHININGGSRAEVNMGRICGPPSLGKTVVSCALISSTLDLPQDSNTHMVPIVGEYNIRCESSSIAAVKLYNDYRISSKGYIPEIHITYSTFLNVTIVVAAANVLTQWEENIKMFTDLRYMTLDGVAALRKFAKVLPKKTQAGQILTLPFDVLLVKAGTVTTSFQFPEKKPPGQQSLLNTVRFCLGDVLIRRLIIDDHDMIPLKSDDYFIPARFTWIVSATQRRTSINVHYEIASNIKDCIKNMNSDKFPILAAAHNDQLNVVVSLKCSQQFVAEYINSTQIVFRQVFVKGGGRAAGILQDLDVPVEVLDMIAADAIGAAAEKLNLNINSIGEVIQRVLGDQKSKYHDSLLTILAMESIMPLVKTPVKVSSPTEKKLPPSGDSIIQDHVSEFREAARQGNKEECARLTTLILADKSINMHAIVSDIKTRAETMRDRTGASLERMRSNIREGECRCCTLPFESGGAVYILANCCQAVVCEHCICDDRKGVKKFIDRCTNCSAPTNHKDIIRVGEELDLQESLNAADPTYMLSVIPDEGATACALAAASTVVNTDDIFVGLPAYAMPKLSALIALIQGAEVPCLRNVQTVPYIKNLLSGVMSKPWPAEEPKKILIFTMYTETTNMISDVLTRIKVPYSILQGTRLQKDTAVEFVRETWEAEPVKVILVTSANNCAGLNMPFLSHVIFYHHIADSCIEAQVAGRGQRLGRSYNLEVIKLLNEGEARHNEVEVV